jgi:FlaA1/EpsC-like NDP-sugar epimerase
MLDNNEAELFFLMEEKKVHNNVMAFLGDVRDLMKISGLMRGCDMVFHCAAYKHVFFSEYNPFESVQTNALGVKNICEAALSNGVQLVIFTSSDKAVNPTSVMGTSKLLGERLITAANIISKNTEQRFCSVRFGNVVGSRGSVFQIFHDQIKKGNPITLTHTGMTRFIMSLERAAQLVLESAVLAQGGEVIVTKMKVISIKVLAEVMIQVLAPYYGHNPAKIPIEIIGVKPGEKMYEELISHEEVGRCLELEELFVVIPAFPAMYRKIDYTYPGLIGRNVEQPYNSREETALTHEETKAFLIGNKLLPDLMNPSLGC